MTEDEKHQGKYVEEPGLIDTYVCSCGWKSKPYFDGEEYARRDWRKHKEAATKLELKDG